MKSVGFAVAKAAGVDCLIKNVLSYVRFHRHASILRGPMARFGGVVTGPDCRVQSWLPIGTANIFSSPVETERSLVPVWYGKNVTVCCLG